jgi:hypothetical protein
MIEGHVAGMVEINPSVYKTSFAVSEGLIEVNKITCNILIIILLNHQSDNIIRR